MRRRDAVRGNSALRRELAERVSYVTENRRDAEELARSMGCPILIRERRQYRRGDHRPTVRREFIVLPDAFGRP
jgi:hypothetical protein